MRHELGAKCLQEIANFSQVLFYSLPNTELQKPGIGKIFSQNITLSCFVKAAQQYCRYALVTAGYNEILLLGDSVLPVVYNLLKWATLLRQLEILRVQQRTFLNKCWFSVSRLYLCISFSVFEDLGLWPLWAIKVVTLQV